MAIVCRGVALDNYCATFRRGVGYSSSRLHPLNWALATLPEMVKVPSSKVTPISSVSIKGQE